MLKNTSLYNLNIVPNRSSWYNSITRLIVKIKTAFIAFYSQFRIKTLVVPFSGSKILCLIRTVLETIINNNTFKFAVSTQQ